MRRVLILCGSLIATQSLPADSPEKSVGTIHLQTNQAAPRGGAEQTLLPVIPGYELKVLDVRKTAIFDVNGGRVEAALPVFFYYPVPGPAIQEFRRAYDELIALGRKPEWSAAELRQVIARLGSAIEMLEKHP